MLKLDPSGRLLKSWGVGLFDFPHGLDIDDDGNVWTADQRRHQVLKFDSEGELLMTIGEKGRSGAPPLLAEPTDVIVAANGDIFITEGHNFANGANRVSKYAADGTLLMSWGRTGSGAGEFNVPHTIALDSQGRVFVGDRANNRIQIFDQEGNFLDVWYQFGRPSGIAIGADDRIYVADSESFGSDNPGWKKGIRVGSARDGSVQYLIEDLEPTAIEHSGAEGVGVDSQEAADVARQLQSTVSIRRAAPLVARLRLLAYQITEGRDLDGDGRRSFDGEAGMQQLEAHLYLLLEGEGLARELHLNCQSFDTRGFLRDHSRWRQAA